MKKIPVSIIIPVYKNYEMFFRNLENNKRYFTGCEVIVMNDYPQEKIASKVRKIIPDAKAFDNKNNLGFGSNVNVGIKKTTRNYIFLLNSDVVLEDDSFLRSIDTFKKDRKVFAISFAQYESDNTLVGANCGYFENGFINHKRRVMDKIGINFWAEGGSAIFSKKILEKVGSFDDLYSPFYWEDIDLSYRAWKMGYKVLYDPAIKVRHYHESTIGKYFQKKSVLKVVYRNQFTFQWKNITDKDLLNQHFLSLPRIIIGSLIKGDATLFSGFMKAVFRLPIILKSRKNTIKKFIKTDKEILLLFK